MLEDRDYMRHESYEPRMSFTVGLLVINAIVFIIQCVGWRFPDGTVIEGSYFALSLDGLQHWRVWELLTFQFMHLNWLHLLLNSLAIFFFGRTVESTIGGARFLAVYFCSGIIGGVFQMIFSFITRDYYSPLVGASAGGMGLIGAFCLMAWDEQFTLYLYFIPVNMKGKTLFWISLGMALLGIVLPNFNPGNVSTNSHIANAAHLGGLLAGFFYVRQIIQGRWRLPEWKLPSRAAAPRELAAKSVGQKSSWKSHFIPPAEDLTKDEFLQKEVDPILDKISARGIQSLTAREREILEKARSRINKR
jgi:membrane associated rhomboid family serine protease